MFTIQQWSASKGILIFLCANYVIFCCRYHLKLAIIDGIDPFQIDLEEFDYSVNGVPPVNTSDVFVYLVLTHSYYTHQQYKAYKSLQSYKYFEDGFVIKTGTKIIKEYFVLIGKVGVYFVYILRIPCYIVFLYIR